MTNSVSSEKQPNICNQTNNQKISTTILLCVFLSYLGVSLPFPILPSILLGEHSLFLQNPVYNEYKSIFYGIILGIYPLGQSLGTCILGRMSDIFGRKKILLLSLGLNIVSYIICIISVLKSQYFLLFLGRFLCGFSDSSCGIAQSIAADKLGQNCKIKQFSYIYVSISLGWIVGPAIGGFLGQLSLFGIHHYITVFLLPALFSLITILMIFCTFKDQESISKNLLEPFFDKPSLTPQLKILLLLNFTIYFGFSCFQQYFPNLLILHLNSSEATIGLTYSFMSTIWISTQYLFIPLLIKRFNTYQTFSFFSILLAFSIFGCAFSQQRYMIYLFIAFIGASSAVCITYATSFVSDHTDSLNQGTLLGLNRSFHSLARTAPALTAGMLSYLHPSFPLIFGSFICLIAFLTSIQNQRQLSTIRS